MASTPEELRADFERAMSDDPTKEGIFRDHRCWRCDDGAKPCPNAGRHCEYPRARND